MTVLRGRFSKKNQLAAKKTEKNFSAISIIYTFALRIRNTNLFKKYKRI